MTIKELKEKLDSLYDPKMMTFNVERSKDKQNTVIISNFSPLTGRSYVMYEIGPKKNDIEITIAYLEGQILGYKELKNKPENYITGEKQMDIDKELLDEFIQQIKNDFSYQHQYNRAYEYLVISDSTNNQEILVIDFAGVGADVTIDEQYFNCGNKASYNLEKLHKLINLLMAIEQMLAKQK